MEDYESIKEVTFKTIQNSQHTTTMVYEWKQKIRRVLLDVKSEFNQWIDKFTYKFVDQLSTVGDNMIRESDSVFRNLVQSLEDQYKQIVKVFYQIQVAPADKKLDTIQAF